MSYLFVEGGPLKGVKLELEEEKENILGSDDTTCTLVLEDPSVSKEAASFLFSEEGIFCKSLSEESPALLNGNPLSEPTLLHEGDLLQIGEISLRFSSEEDKEKEEPVEVAEEKTEAPTAPEEKIETSEEETPTPQPPIEEKAPHHKTIYEDVSDGTPNDVLAEIDFDLKEMGRWLLKVVAGPNHGAEFSMQEGETYTLGTDPSSCDVVFHDTSVSRQHVRVSIDHEGNIAVEDLNSRNGTFVDGERIEGKRAITSNTLVTIGTTSFVIYDREGEMHTIISPLLPSIVKMLQKEEAEKDEEDEEEALAQEEAVEEPPSEKKVHNALSAFIVVGVITAIFVVVGIGVLTLFQSKPIEENQELDIAHEIENALAPFPTVKYSFNKTNGKLFLVGHVLSGTDKSQLLYNLQGLKFIKGIDDAGIVIDEFVWREINQVLGRQTKWRGINIQSPVPGKFILSGYLKSRKEAEELSDYLTTNFPYLDRLENRVIVEENIVTQVKSALQKEGINNLEVEMGNGELTVSGGVPQAKVAVVNEQMKKFREIPGIRSIKNFVTEVAAEQAMVNISGRYIVSGSSQKGGVAVSVVIDGRIYSKGDILDGMTITELRPNAIFLEKAGVKYRIDYSK